MEHSSEYNRIMDVRKKREERRSDRMRNLFTACGLSVIVLGLALLALHLGIKGDHKKAVRDYNDNNWIEVVNIPNGKKIHGKVDGEEFAYNDDGRYFGGIYVDDVCLEGMTYEEARQALLKSIENKLNTISMVINVGDASLTLGARDFNISVNANQVLKDAYQLGRESINDYGANYLKQKKLLEEPVHYNLVYNCDKQRIEERVASIADFVNTKPKNAYITVSQKPSANTDAINMQDDTPIIKDTDTIVETVHADNGKAIAYIYYNPGRSGYVLNEKAMVERIIQAFDSGDYDCSMTAELEYTEPEVTPSDIKGSIVQITSYTSEFDHDEKDMNRCRNIQKAAGILNGCTVKPGQEISFNKYVGPRTEAGGWLRAHGIVNGREYEDSPGGGICQVSGTLYNALLQCGPRMKVTQRQHHSWPSSYVPIGLDATVDTNGPDLKWRNVSDSTLYIFTYADVKKGKMYVYVYGTPEADGSYYKTYAEVTEEIEPPEPTIVNQPLWPTGYEKETITARVGYEAKAYLDHLDKNGELIERKYLYTDRYSPVKGEITRGTGPSYLPKPTKNN